MAEVENPVLVNIFRDVAALMKVPGTDQVHYEPGRSIQILSSLSDLDNSITMKGLKYPLLAVKLPIREQFKGSGSFITAIIDRIVIANLVFRDSEEYVIEKYMEDGNYTKILYPCYTEFFRCLALNKFVVGLDPGNFIHTKMDNPCQQPIGQGMNDYVDSIEILNLELTLTQIKTCK